MTGCMMDLVLTDCLIDAQHEPTSVCRLGAMSKLVRHKFTLGGAGQKKMIIMKCYVIRSWTMKWKGTSLLPAEKCLPRH